MFIDEVTIDLEAGSGGNGCMAFRRVKYVEMGGPYGGNGGKGADIIFKVDEGLNTLLDLRYKKLIRGDKGENGLGKGMHGAAAENVIVKVPEGTVITDMDTGLIIADLVKNGEEAVVAHGGRGGRGNIAFATRSNPAPNFAENGEPGEVKRVKVELKLLADVGLVGLPSVGKSTFISKISAVKPKIAAYHFTTLKPNLGVVRASNNRSFVVADLPGLIKGASLGEGLGDKFLKHIERTRVIAHIIDMSAFEGRDPYEDYLTINKELEDFNKKIIDKPQIIIANKMDMPTSKENLKKFKEKVNVEVFEMSAMNGEGIDKIINNIMREINWDGSNDIEKIKIFNKKFKEVFKLDFTKENYSKIIMWRYKSEKDLKRKLTPEEEILNDNLRMIMKSIVKINKLTNESKTRIKAPMVF